MRAQNPPPAEVVDSHVHVFPPEMVRDRELLCSRERWFELLYLNPRALLVTTETLIETMDAAGVGRAVLCGFPWIDPAVCREHNAYLAESTARFPDRLTWLGIVSPLADDAAAEAEWCFASGAAGIGELNADAQGFDWRDGDHVTEIAKLCISKRKPMLIHASEPVGHNYPGKGLATPDKIVGFLERFPELHVVAAHWGGGLPFYELMPEVSAACANVVYDCAASTYLYQPRVFRTVLDLVGAERVLFGSDYPVLRMDRFIERMLALEWSDAAELAAVLGGNARRVFRIERQGEEKG